MINFASVFPNGDDTIINPNGKKIILCAMDAEWLSNHTLYTNLILSYQFSVINLYDGKAGDSIYYTDYHNKERLSFTAVFEQIAGVLSMSLHQLEGYTIIIIAHNAIAEWSTIANRKKLVGVLQQIRKTVITPGVNARGIRIYDKNRNAVNLSFMLKDTILLVPESHKSLKKASILVDPNFSKLDIGTEKLSDMLKFLQESPVEFEAYALRDTQVTLKLWIVLQSILNSTNGTSEKIYSTISGASVSAFVNSMDKGVFNAIFRRH